MRVEYSLLAPYIIKITANLWHQRLGHPGNQAIKSMGLVDSLNRCSACELNKIHKLPFNPQLNDANKALECIKIHMVGLIPPPSVSGNQFFLTIVYQATSFEMVNSLKHKSEALKRFFVAKAYMENLQNLALKKLVSNCGGEFLNKDFNPLTELKVFLHIF
ncbi:hypothetical protein O181_095301 [Austropuccinia psidii MF-1]|uniref:GAG-pre-integrase domain-containing protein n=1 Tax=Austropuccinia psidii MF-1 TaxID=1389203 RepID=A0A9Q3J561_9BASI|nr:hypothetical protein [Austropuccinia psidii MF-1]